MSEIKLLRRKINSLEVTIINQLQDEVYKRGCSSAEHNTKTIFNTMESQIKQIIEEIVSKTEVITSKVIDGSETNVSNITDIAIEEEEEEEGNECFGECFDDEVLYLRQKVNSGSKFGAKKEEKIYGGISSCKSKYNTL